MKKLTLLLILSSFISLSTAQATTPPVPAAPQSPAVAASPTMNIADFSGNYKCQGYDPYNKQNYSYAKVTFVKNDTVYNIQWQDENGNPIMLGTGLVNPNVMDSLAVIYSTPKKEFFNLGNYKRNPDGSLQSTWISEGNKLIGNETCNKI